MSEVMNITPMLHVTRLPFLECRNSVQSYKMAQRLSSISVEGGTRMSTPQPSIWRRSTAWMALLRTPKFEAFLTIQILKPNINLQSLLALVSASLNHGLGTY